MRALKSSIVFALAFALGLSAPVLHAQLPGPPVGAPQVNQNASRGYNFQYTFVPSSTTSSGFEVNPTLNLTTATGHNADLATVAGSIVFPNSSASGTLAAALHVGTLTCTLNSATLTTCANLVVDAAPSTGTNKFAAWIKGDLELGTSNVSAAGSLSCGNALAAGGACGNVNQAGTFKVLVGTYVLAGNTSAVTGVSPAFTSATSYNCVANDITTRANPVQAIPVSGSAFTITNTTGATDTISVICAGN